VSDHDAGVLASLMLFAGVVGARNAMLLADRTAHDVEALGAGLGTFAAGDLSHRIEPAGPRELRDLADSANEMAAALEHARAERDDADRARRNLIASVSHDLRTPLTSLRLLVEAIDDGVLAGPEETAEALRRAKQHVATLSTLVDDLFELARLEAGDISWTLSQVGVAELIDETVEAFRPQAEQKGLVLSESVPSDVAPVRGNPEKLQRVLYNLMQNAVRHTPQDGTVTLRAERDDGFVRIEVADDGEGIPSDQAEHVYGSLNPLKSATIIDAALTGILLWLAALIGGWCENFAVYNRIPAAIAQHPLGQKIGVQRMQNVATWFDRNIAAWSTSISLGYLMGFMPEIAHFFGLPLDVRHVTLNTGMFAFAAVRFGSHAFTQLWLYSAVAGIATMFVLNLGVSFAIASFVALRAYDVRGRTAHESIFNLNDGHYLRTCESEWAAGMRITLEAQLHGLTFEQNSVENGDQSGSPVVPMPGRYTQSCLSPHRACRLRKDVVRW